MVLLTGPYAVHIDVTEAEDGWLGRWHIQRRDGARMRTLAHGALPATQDTEPAAARATIARALGALDGCEAAEALPGGFGIASAASLVLH
jgi:hypothetical protein